MYIAHVFLNFCLTMDLPQIWKRTVTFHTRYMVRKHLKITFEIAKLVPDFLRVDSNLGPLTVLAQDFSSGATSLYAGI